MDPNNPQEEGHAKTNETEPNTISKLLSGPIQDYLSTPVPQELWHYTSFKAMHSIIEQKAIYATDARFLNDRHELRHAADYANHLISTQNKPKPILEFVGAHVSDWFRVLLNLKNPFRNYVTCFSERRDDLSQWRAYSGQSTGVSLGFRFDKRHDLSPCVYQDDMKRILLLAAFSKIFKAAEIIFEIDPLLLLKPEQSHNFELLNKFPDIETYVKGASSTLLIPLIKLIPLFKDASFESEQEWRMVNLVQNHGRNVSGEEDDSFNNSVFYRPTRETLVPTLVVDLQKGGSIPVSSLYLGPGSHPYAEDATNRFLAFHQIPITSAPSAVPYRSAISSQS